MTLTISELARRSGLPATTLRYYEKAGILPSPDRSDSGYRRYDEDAVARLAFVQRAKTLGIDLDDIAQLVRLWDGDECGPVQAQLRAKVHDQRAATARRLDELTQLGADLDAVAATLGAAETCGPDCACVRPVQAQTDVPMVSERMIGASCALSATDLRQRLADWRALRDRAGRADTGRRALDLRRRRAARADCQADGARVGVLRVLHLHPSGRWFCAPSRDQRRHRRRARREGPARDRAVSDMPKRELAVVGAACAVCCVPLIVGAVVAAPAVAAVGGAAAIGAGAAAVVRRRRKPAAREPLP